MKRTESKWLDSEKRVRSLSLSLENSNTCLLYTSRRSKGFAFVEMPETSEASNDIKQLNGVEYAGRPMVIKEALPRN